MKLIREQQAESLRRVEKERGDWQKEKSEEATRLDHEVQRMMEQYERKLVQLDDERKTMGVERKAFQEEQMLILDWIERKREELDSIKSEFLTKEHDLLVRVVNEKTLVEQERLDFERRRNADVARIHHEAVQLEASLAQVENAKNSLIRARSEYRRKIDQINGIKEMLLEYEKAYWGEKKRGVKTKI